MPTVRQKIYAFVTTHNNVTTAQVAQHICKSESYTAKAMFCMKTANMLLSTKMEGTQAHMWRVSNKAVKFNTGETVRQVTKRKASVKQQIAALEAGLAALKAQIA